MKITKRTHPGYLEEKESRQIFGRWQYIASSDKGKISIVKILYSHLFTYKTDHWEIYCLSGKLFTDIRQFKTLKEAKKVCKKYLT